MKIAGSQNFYRLQMPYYLVDQTKIVGEGGVVVTEIGTEITWKTYAQLPIGEINNIREVQKDLIGWKIIENAPRDGAK